MNPVRLASYVKEYGIRSGALRTADRLLGRKTEGVSYEEWLRRSRPSAHDYQRMKREQPQPSPLIGVTASMREEDRTPFFQSLNMQVYRNFRALKNCPQAEYVLIADGPCILRPDLLWECASALAADRSGDIVLLYFDSDTIGEEGRKCETAFRPDFDPDLLERVNYMGNLVLVRADAARRAGLPAAGADAFHRFLVRVCLGNDRGAGRSEEVRHIPKILYHQAWIDSREDSCDSEPSFEDGEEPLVSVLIPNKDHVRDLECCVNSLLEVSTWKNLEILILENNSCEEETSACYERLQDRDGRIRVLRWDGPFNYSAINNFGAAHAHGEYLLLLNNDTQIMQPDSISILQHLVSGSGVGAAGALLLYPDGRVQHAGIILGHGGIAGHAWEGERPMERADPFEKMVFSHTHNVSAVTGACMMVRRSAWNEAGGMDESLEVTFNDVDLCMRLRKNGWKILQSPRACLIHDESASRGSEDTPEKVERFHREIGIFVHRWEEELEKGDPFYNPNLSLEGRSWTCRDMLREDRKPYVKYLHLCGEFPPV